MSLDAVERVASALLYEGYMLYPYRASSVKNRQRFNFGVVVPHAFAASAPTESSIMQTECVIEAPAEATVEVHLRFLHLVERTLAALATPMADPPTAHDPRVRAVETLVVDGRRLHAWQEAVERRLTFASGPLGDRCHAPLRERIALPAAHQVEPVRDARGLVVGLIRRDSRPLEVDVEVSARRTGDDLFVVRARIENRTPIRAASASRRDEVLPASLVSTHTILVASRGAFVSAIDPPEARRAAVAGCRNIGTYPVLAGEPDSRDIVLSSPIIVYDHPEVAPESAGDLFDATEIDEILSLRILTLTDDEQREIGEGDERARLLLERTQKLGKDEMLALHGIMRRSRDEQR